MPGNSGDIYQYRALKAIRGRTKSQLFRSFYKPLLTRLLNKESWKMKDAPFGKIKVRFTKYGNKHLYNDAYTGNGGLRRSDLFTLDKLLEKSAYAGESDLYKERSDNINHFYYYKIRLHGNDAYLNIARERRGKRNIYYVYSVTYKM